MAHRVTPGHPEVTPGTKSYWHTSTTPSLVWQTKYVKCVRAIANHMFNTISCGDKTMLKWATAIGTHALTAKQLPSIQMRKVANSAAHARFSCHDSGHGCSACLNSQNNHPPHGTPSSIAFPTYKLGCDRRYIPMVSMINSTSCQSTLSSTSPWHTADRIDFLFSGHLLMLLVSSAQLPALSQISWFSAQKLHLAQKQQHKQQQQQQQQTKQQIIAKPFQNLSGLCFDWLQF